MTDADPFSQFKAVFFTECDELTSDMEQHLSDLESGGGDDETLNAIFRAVHSIKAGAGAFQFTELVSYSHVFEALLDKLRSGDLALDEGVTQTLFRASDILSDFIDAAQNEQAPATGHGLEIQAEMEALLTGTAHVKQEQSSKQEAKEKAPVAKSGGKLTYSVKFEPNAEVFRHANEPILLIRELQTLGELDVEVDISSLPSLRSLEPEDSYLKWNMKLITGRPLEDIEEVFEFVEDDCKLDISLLDSEEADQPNQEISSSATVETKRVPLEIEAFPAGADMTNAAPVASKAKPKTTSIRVDLDRLDKLVNMVGELVITQAMLTQELESIDQSQNQRLISGMEELASHARELQENVMAVRMQSVKSVFSRMPRLVRDLSSQLNKKVKLITSGEDTEVDKTVIEEIADPLTHMIRNSLDHGIELPEVREKNGKDPEGTIWLSAAHRGGRIIIEISDDGQGINRERVLSKAKEKNLITDENMSDEEIDNLIFHPGFSTAEAVTNVSGRGVGMDVVRKNILSLGGRISVQSEAGKGSKFTLSLPLTLAVLDGMIVGVSAEKYVIPVNSIIESVRPAQSDVMTLFGDTQVLRIRGQYIPLVPIVTLFDIVNNQENVSQTLVVIVDVGGGDHVGIIVDELIGQQQVVIKSLETNYKHIDGISAATILGNGQVCLILDVDGLEEMERKRRGGRRLKSSDIDQAVSADQKISA